jgi:hypothetical protein
VRMIELCDERAEDPARTSIIRCEYRSIALDIHTLLLFSHKEDFVCLG